MKKTLYTTVATIMIATGCVSTDSSASDVMSGKWYFSDTLNQNLKSWGRNVVKAADGHPVRSGKKSMRFEVRSGDCSWSRWSHYYSDCDNHAERRELKQSPQSEGGNGNERGENWYHYSIYLPNDFPIIWPSKTTLGQFHDGNKSEVYNRSFMFDISERGNYFVDNRLGGKTRDDIIISVDEMKGKWTDILIHANWTHKNDGFLRIYVNGSNETTYSWTGITKRRGDNIHFKFGIYRRDVYSEYITIPTQVAYYDDIRKGKSCEDVTNYFDCKEIPGGISKKRNKVVLEPSYSSVPND